jgi:hypothetical protein
VYFDPAVLVDISTPAVLLFAVFGTVAAADEKDDVL